MGRPSCPFLPHICPFKAANWLISRHQTLHFGESFIKIEPTLKSYQYLTSTLWANWTNWWYFSYFSQKTSFDISWKLSPVETICMKCQILFSRKIKKNISVCRLLKILPRVDTEHITWHMVPSFLYDRTKSAQCGTSLPWNPSWSTENSMSPLNLTKN